MLDGTEFDKLNHLDGDIEPLNEPSSVRNEAFKQLYALIKKKLRKCGERAKHYYNLRHRPNEFLIGQVWRRNCTLSDGAKYYNAKLGPLYLGPFRVKERVSRWVYELENLDGTSVGGWHAKDLRSAPDDD